MKIKFNKIQTEAMQFRDRFSPILGFYHSGIITKSLCFEIEHKITHRIGIDHFVNGLWHYLEEKYENKI